MTNLEDSIKIVQEQIALACSKAGRKAGEVKLIAVTKRVAVESIENAIRLGLKDFGENYIREATEKIDRLGAVGINWHMIGHVQTNKARHIPGYFEYLHSVDRMELFEKLNTYGKPIKVLFEMNLSGEATKDGTNEDGLRRMLEKAASLSYLKPVGLMTMAPYVDDPEKVRSIFSALRKTIEVMNREFSLNMKELSMGMSSDFKVAIEEGATMVRIGTALFGERI